jgi:hypothetical protein
MKIEFSAIVENTSVNIMAVSTGPDSWDMFMDDMLFDRYFNCDLFDWIHDELAPIG